jgi:hypothetical protein
MVASKKVPPSLDFPWAASTETTRKRESRLSEPRSLRDSLDAHATHLSQREPSGAALISSTSKSARLNFFFLYSLFFFFSFASAAFSAALWTRLA